MIIGFCLQPKFKLLILFKYNLMWFVIILNVYSKAHINYQKKTVWMFSYNFSSTYSKYVFDHLFEYINPNTGEKYFFTRLVYG